MNKTFILSLSFSMLGISIMLYGVSEHKKNCGEYLGHILWERSLKEKDLDVQDVLNGFQEASQNIPPKLSSEEAYRLLLELEKQKFEKLVERNLQQSVAFLKEIASQSDVVPLIPEKIYIKIIYEGIGEGLLAHESGWFKLKAFRPDEPPFYENNEGVMQSLDAAIEGFSRGALGMKIGEKRIIYVHPEYAYGINNRFQPNTVVVIEAERVAPITNSVP